MTAKRAATAPARPPPNGAQRAPSASQADLDGTLIHDDGYTHKPETLRWQPGAIEAIPRAKCAGVLAIVVTNQSGVARGYYTEDDMRLFHTHMNEKLGEHGAHIDGSRDCIYAAKASRKTLTGRSLHRTRWRASSLYHIMFAMVELIRVTERLKPAADDRMP